MQIIDIALQWKTTLRLHPDGVLEVQSLAGDIGCTHAHVALQLAGRMGARVGQADQRRNHVEEELAEEQDRGLVLPGVNGL